MSENTNTVSSTERDSQYNQGPASGTDTATLDQNQADSSAYSELRAQGSDDMGGGRGAMGSGVAGGYEGNSQSTQQQSGEKQDWLDKGITSLGQKAGFDMSKNADKIGDQINEQFTKREGRSLPGVQ